MKCIFCLVVLCLLNILVLANQESSDYSIEEEGQECRSDRQCRRNGLKCINGYCICSPGFLIHPHDGNCIKCPTLGQSCFGHCCNGNRWDKDSQVVQCWNGVCRSCFDTNGNWNCSNQTVSPVNHILLASSLLVGIFATFFIFYKLCSTVAVVRYVNSRYSGNPGNTSRLSVGSMQIYLQRRLRDAPPKYTMGEPSAPVISVISAYENEGFVHDYSSTPPPLYSLTLRKQSQDLTESVHV